MHITNFGTQKKEEEIKENYEVSVTKLEEIHEEKPKLSVIK